MGTCAMSAVLCSSRDSAPPDSPSTCPTAVTSRAVSAASGDHGAPSAGAPSASGASTDALVADGGARSAELVVNRLPEMPTCAAVGLTAPPPAAAVSRGSAAGRLCCRYSLSVRTLACRLACVAWQLASAVLGPAMSELATASTRFAACVLRSVSPPGCGCCCCCLDVPVPCKHATKSTPARQGVAADEGRSVQAEANRRCCRSSTKVGRRRHGSSHGSVVHFHDQPLSIGSAHVEGSTEQKAQSMVIAIVSSSPARQ